MRDTTSTLLPPVALWGELATLGHQDRRGGTKLLQHSGGGSTRTCYPGVSQPVRPQGRSGSAPLASCRGPGRGGAHRAFPGGAPACGRCGGAAPARLPGRHLLAGPAAGVPVPRPPDFPTPQSRAPSSSDRTFGPPYGAATARISVWNGCVPGVKAASPDVRAWMRFACGPTRCLSSGLPGAWRQRSFRPGWTSGPVEPWCGWWGGGRAWLK